MQTVLSLRDHKCVTGFLMLILALTLASCAGPKDYTVRLHPHPVGENGPTTQSTTVGLVPFVDERSSPKILGKRTLSNGEEVPILLASASVSEDVTYILRSFLKARNIGVVEISSWEPIPEHLKDLPAGVKIAIAGHVKALEVEAQSSTFKTTVRYRVKLSTHVGYAEKGEVVIQSVEVAPEESVARFKREKIEEGINEALATALTNLLDATLGLRK